MPTMGDNPRKFIRHNLLTLATALNNPRPPRLRENGTVWVTLTEIPDVPTVRRNRNRKGLARLMPRMNGAWWTKPARFYSVDPSEEGSPDTFPAYICPYEANLTRFKMLQDDADVMFTANMTGCTFGVGIPNPQGGVLVGHANAMELATGDEANPDFAPQRNAQRTDLDENRLGGRVVDPDAYRRGTAPDGGEFLAVTIGLRVGGVWEFWYQHQLSTFDVQEKFATIKIR